MSDSNINVNTSLAGHPNLDCLERSRSSSTLLEECIEVTTPSTPRPKEQMKICDKLRTFDSNEVRYSFEFFPPNTLQATENLTHRIARMGLTHPLFVDIVHSKNSGTLTLTNKILEHTSLDVMPHLSMTNMSEYDIRTYLDSLKDLGIRNVLVIRGDPPRGYDTWEAVDDTFLHAADLVKFIRHEYGDYFCICVGAYPEGHVNCLSLEQDIAYLKEKIEAGANLVITQLFYDVPNFLEFLQQCRAVGIECPIIPGIMPIHTYSQFVKIVSFNNIVVPPKIWDDLEDIKENDEKVKEYGIQLTVEMCREIIQNDVKMIHFYSMNMERSVTKTLQQLKLLLSSSTDRSLFPWPCAQPQCRNTKESVRPIFWANRSQSYLQRTSHWDEFPNGRWGDNRSPAYGEFPDHHLLRSTTKTSIAQRRKMYGADLHSVSDICDVFVNYLSGTIGQLPWCTQPILPETSQFLLQPLRILNEKGFLTINSQPQVNGAPSTEATVGWGRTNGIVYQKAYLEFFCNPIQLQSLLQFLDKYPSLSYQAVNAQNALKSNCELTDVNAVTWGVFPRCEVIQPTIVDPQSFLAWKDEAFSLWTSIWRRIYDRDSNGYKLISVIVNEWFLVNIVENNYISGNIFAPFVDYFRFIHAHKNAETLQQHRNIIPSHLNATQPQSTTTQSSAETNDESKTDSSDIQNDSNNNGDNVENNNNNNNNSNGQSNTNQLDDIVNPYLDPKVLLFADRTDSVISVSDGKSNAEPNLN